MTESTNVPTVVEISYFIFYKAFILSFEHYLKVEDGRGIFRRRDKST